MVTAVNLSADSSRPINVWLIPGEEAEARASADPRTVGEEIRAFNRELEGGRVRVLNTLPPDDAQLIVWNTEFAVPNWAWIKNQKQTLRALERFAEAHDTRVNVRFVTWDRAFANLNQPRGAFVGAPPPDIVQIGSTWAAYFASRGMIASRPRYTSKGAIWEPVGRILPAAVLPYINDVRLFFYWKRLPLDDPQSPPLIVNTTNWEQTIKSLSSDPLRQDRIAFANGLTLNLLMDYSMLVWAGGAEPIVKTPWRSYADFTSAAALRVPLLLTAEARNQPRRVVVPESSHQEVTQAFVAAGYRATIEPANFISRWKKDFDKTFGEKKNFWDYAAADVPPGPFHGGSYLAVMSFENPPESAFELAEFLATDEAYTRVLAENGHLPSLRPGYGMDVLLKWLGGSGESEAEGFTKLVQRATLQGKTFPPLPMWPIEVESLAVQEALQRVWRRIGEGDPEAVTREAADAQRVLNARIDWVTQWRQSIRQLWWLLIPISVAAGIVLWRRHRRTVRELRDRNEALLRDAEIARQIRMLRGFSASALLALGKAHRNIKEYRAAATSDDEAMKRSVIAAGISGWRRGRKAEEWQPATAEDVIWKSILLAFDFEKMADLYEKWELVCAAAPVSLRSFLENTGRLRQAAVPGNTEISYYFQVEVEPDLLLSTPFLMRQALTCLIQNAIQAVDRAAENAGGGPRAVVSILATREAITVSNPGEPLPGALRSLINGSITPEDFEARVLRALRTAGGAPPGVGLVEASVIAMQCYSGLHISNGPPCVAILLRAQGADRANEAAA